MVRDGCGHGFVTVFTHDEDVDRDGVGVEEGGQEVDG